MNWKDIIGRAVATFVQASAAMLITSSAGWLDNVAPWKAALVGGGSAVISLAYRTSQQYLDKHPEAN